MKIKINKQRIAALLVSGMMLFTTGCGKKKSEVPTIDTKHFTYSFEDYEALHIIPYQLKNFKQMIEEENKIGMERELEKKYIFDIGKCYDCAINPDYEQNLYIIGHNIAYDESIKNIWNAINDSKKTLMSTAYLKNEFKSVFPDPKRYSSYYYYIGNSSIFSAFVDYQILKSESYDYYLLKTYSLTLNKQPQGIKATWPVGETFKYTVFAKINMEYNVDGYTFNGVNIIAEQIEGIGSDAVEFKEGSVNINDVLHPVEKSKTLKLTKN